MTPYGDQPETTATQSSGVGAGADRLLPQHAATDFQARWENIQHAFVDEPRDSINKADALVGEVMRQLSGTFEEQRLALEQQWSAGEPTTEELRAAFRRYRVFFDRLLNV